MGGAEEEKDVDPHERIGNGRCISMGLTEILKLLAGIGLFLFGMSILGTALEKAAGEGLKKLLEKLTNNRFKGLALGTGVAGIIQSSSATIIMIIGLLNAGLITLYQALPVIMGANIGTTVTGQILRLGDIGNGGVFLQFLKPSTFGPILIAVGAFLNMFGKKSSQKTAGRICIGLGMLFFGMDNMESGLSVIKEAAWFEKMIRLFSNPLLGVLVGALLTALLQSASASTGILQAMASAGTMPFATMIPMVMGQNIGKCVTVFLASFGGTKDAKRATFLHLLVNLFGFGIFFALIYGAKNLFGFSLWDWNATVTRGNIADFNTVFSAVSMLILLPFSKGLIALSERVIRSEAPSDAEKELLRLDDLLLKTPAVALEQARQVVITMAKLAKRNFSLSVELITDWDDKKNEELVENESLLDKCESAVNNYIVKIAMRDLTDRENKLISELLHSVGDFERIGDYSVNLSELALGKFEKKTRISQEAWKEFIVITDAVREVIATTVTMYEKDDTELARHVEPLEEVIDFLQITIKDKHIARFSRGECNVDTGTLFVEILSNLERISDHCSAIAVNVIQRKEGDLNSFSGHTMLNELHMEPTELYKRLYDEYYKKYTSSGIL